MFEGMLQYVITQFSSVLVCCRPHDKFLLLHYLHLTASQRTSFNKALHIWDDLYNAHLVFNHLLIDAALVASG